MMRKVRVEDAGSTPLLSGATVDLSEVKAENRKIEARIAERAAAKKAKNYAEADRIRAELAALGVTLTDTPQGTKYSR